MGVQVGFRSCRTAFRESRVREVGLQGVQASAEGLGFWSLGV